MLTNLYNSGKIRDVRREGLRIIDDALNEVNNAQVYECYCQTEHSDISSVDSKVCYSIEYAEKCYARSC